MIKPLLAALLSCIACSNVNATSLWQDTSSAEMRQLRGTSSLQQQNNQIFRFNEARLLSLDMMALDGYLNAALPEASTTTITIQLPLPHGEFVDYLLYDSPVMEPGLAAKYPEIRTFKVVAANNPAFTGRLDLTPQGFHAVLQRGTQTVFIDPLGNNNHYQSYYKHDYAAHKVGMPDHQPFICNHNGNAHLVDGAQATLSARLLNTSTAIRAARVSFGTQIKTYRLAIAATGEFTEFHGGTKAKALAALVTGINRINEVYERDLAVKLKIIDNNDAIIYTNPNSDPFDGSRALSDLAGPTIDQAVGAANYDVGHVVSGSGIGGQAGLGVICNDADKAGGETSSDSPINDPFFIDFVAHELGHQFGARHSFNGTSGSCGGGNRSGSHAYEPGSGTTIMGYAGICGSENVQANSDAYFHSDSIEQIREHLDTGSGNGCGVSSGSNRLPTAEAGVNKIIPAQTPFTLTGSGSDADGDTLSYTWEQFNLGPATRSRGGLVDDGKRPIFRSFTPTTSPTRTLPQLSDVLAGITTYGELLPRVSRDLNFRLTVRDGKGGVVSDGMKVQVVDSAGPFKITSPTSNSWSSSNQTVVWDVANTDAAPISCAMVKIDMSTDGGTSFPTTLLASTANDGNATVTLPAVDTSQGRIRVSCTNQPFFAVNSANIRINSSGASSNNIPVALNDSFSFEQSPNARQLDVLNNDRDSDGDDLTITNVDSIGGHNIAISSDGRSISFTHSNNFSGTVNFNYTISDGTARASAGISVTITAPTPTPTVTPVPTPTPTPLATPTPATNQTPIANSDSYEIVNDGTKHRFTPLDNDTDADGDTLTIVSVNNFSNGGTAVITNSGKALDYQPATGFTGTEIINYTIRDARNDTASANLSITVNKSEDSNSGDDNDGGGGSTGWLFLLSLLLLTVIRVMWSYLSVSQTGRATQGIKR